MKTRVGTVGTLRLGTRNERGSLWRAFPTASSRSVVVVVLVLLLAAPAFAAGDQPASLVTPPVLPDPVQLVVGAIVTFLVVNGLKDFFAFTGKDLTGWATVMAATFTAIVVFAINALLALAVTIDPDLAPKIEAFFQILVILLGAMGVKRMQRAA